jgi:DNA-binding HxlR family transcriptional regulator
MSFTTPKPQVDKVEKRAGCIQAALCVFGDKWTPLLVGQLVSAPMTFGDLEAMLTGISPRTLSARLEKLQTEEIIIRRQYQARPQRFKYQLTEKGLELQHILSQMAEWGAKYSHPKTKLTKMNSEMCES